MRRGVISAWIALGTVGATGTLTACGTDPYRVQELGQVRAWVIGSAEAGGEALASGTARWVPEDRCWVLEPVLDEPSIDARTQWRAIVWPADTTIASDSPPTLRVGALSIIDGDEISGASAGTGTPPSGLDIPSGCRPNGVVVINRLEGAKD